jgi:hypothetical protein
MRNWVYAAGLSVALLAAGGCDVVDLDLHAASVEGTFERTLTVNGPVDLAVRTGSGDIQIRAGSDNSVHLIGRIRARSTGFGDKPEQRMAEIQAHPPIEQAGNSLRIGFTNPGTDDDPLYRNVRISYELVVPAQTQVQARSGSGDINVALTAANVDARTGSGDINVLGTSGRFEAHTGSGDVHAGKIAGPLKATTGSGDIAAAQTVEAPVQMQTGSGDVTLSLAENAAFNVDVHTGSGSIATTHQVTLLGTRSRHRLEGTVRGGGPVVEIRTGSGSVEIN